MDNIQLIARVKGGKVGRARKGPELCLGNITILKDAVSPENYFGEEVPTSLRIIKSHQDEVLVLPENAKLLAYSSMYEVEMYSIEDNFLCIQGHPEYNRDILIDILDRVLAGGHITVCSSLFFLINSLLYIHIILFLSFTTLTHIF